MTDDQSIACVAVLVAAFPDSVVGPETLTLYARFLRDVDEEVGATAVATWIARERKFPLIADIRAQVDSLLGTAPPDIDQAWDETMRAVRKGRPPVRWSHEAVRLAVEAVGFREIGQSTTPGVERAHFEKAYQAARRRTADRASAALVRSIAPEVRGLINAPRLATASNPFARQLPEGKKKGGK